MKDSIQKTRPKLIGLTGGKGCGKDTCADYLLSTYHFKKISFAAPLKKALAAMFDVPMSTFEDPAIKETPRPELLGKTPRFLMQTLGTEWGRDIVSSTLWVDLAMQEALIARSDRHSVVVSDVRFTGEAEAIKAQGGHIWLVERNQTIYNKDAHASERGIDRDLVDFVVRNNHDLRTLYTQIGVGLAHIDREHGPVYNTPIGTFPPI